MNANFEAPTEESETLQSVFIPVIDESQKLADRSVYYVSFTEIMAVLKLYGGNNYLKAYNLQTAMRKCGYTVKSYKRVRFNNQPRNLYAVQLIDPSKVWLINKMDEYL